MCLTSLIFKIFVLFVGGYSCPLGSPIMALFKKTLVTIFVLAVSITIFYFLVNDQGLKANILRTTLDLFGKQLFALVPDGEQKEKLQLLYGNFMHKAETDQVPPEEVERVAATILNLTNQDAPIPADAAISALAFSFSDLPSPPGDAVFPAPKPETWTTGWRRTWEKHDHRELAERLRSMNDFNFQVRQVFPKDSVRQVKQQFFFVADSGLCVAMDVEMQRKLAQEKAEKLLQSINEMDKKNWVLWQKQFELKNLENTIRPFLHAQNEFGNVSLPRIEVKVQPPNLLYGNSLDSFKIAIADSLRRYAKISIKAVEQEKKIIEQEKKERTSGKKEWQ